MTDQNAAHGTVTGAWYAISGSVSCAGGSFPSCSLAAAPVVTPGHANDGNDATAATFQNEVMSGTGTFGRRLQSDLGSAYDVTVIRTLVSTNAHQPALVYSSADGATWSLAAGSWATVSGHYVFTLTTTTQARYWRIAWTYTTSGFKYVDIESCWTWDITGTAPAPGAPIADFSADPVSGTAPLAVDFTDLSTNTPTSWAWDFGDGGTSTSQNPSHTFTDAGSYDVTLTATNAGGSGSVTKTEFIVAARPTTVGAFADWDGDGFGVGDHDDITANVISWDINRGSGPEITSGADPGSMTLVCKNPDDIYNPRNPDSPLYGALRDGVPIFVAIADDGTFTGSGVNGLFGGRITDITPIPAGGASTSPTVEILCEDMLGWARRTPVFLDYAEGRSHKALREAALIAAGETSYDLDDERQTMPLSHVDGNLGNALDDLNGVTGTCHLCKPGTTFDAWYVYTTRNRYWRIDGTSDGSLGPDDHVTDASSWRLSADTVTNEQRATVQPIVFTPGTFTVWEADALPFDVTTRRPFTKWVDFDDVVRDPVLDIASTGAALTATLTPFATTALIELSVASGTASVTALSVEGRLARRPPTESYVADDPTSQAAPRGVRAGGEIAGEYLGVLAEARGIANHIVWRYPDPQLRPTITVANWLPSMFQVDLYDVIAYTSPQLVMDGHLFEIVGLTHHGRLAAPDAVYHTVDYVLQEARVQEDPGWFVIGSSLLGGGDVLAY